MSRVSRNIVYNGLGQGLSLLLGFVAVRFVFRRLGGDALGLIYFSLAFSVALSVAVRLGICESAVREVASHHGNRPEYIKNLIRTSSLLYWAAYLILGLVAYTATPYLIRHWVKLDSMDALNAIKMMRILTLGALLTLPGDLYRALLVGLQHMGLTNLIDVAGKATQQGGIFLILLIHGSLFHVAYWIAFATLMPVVVYWIVCTHFFSVRALVLPGFSLAVIKENLRYASGLMTITLCAWAFTQADRVVVSRLLPLTILGLYSFVRGATGQGMLLTAAVNNAVFPHFAHLHGAGNAAEMKSSYHKIHDLICYATVPIFAAGPFVAIPVLSRIFDMPSAHMLLLPLTFLCLGYYMNGTLTTPYAVSLAVGRPDITARQNFYALFLVLPFTVAGIYFYGLNGAAFSWVLYHIFYYVYGMPRICRECLGMPARVWHAHVLKIMASAILIYGGAWTVRALVGSFSIPWVGGTFAAATLIYCAAGFHTMSQETRRAIVDFVKLCRLKREEALVAH